MTISLSCVLPLTSTASLCDNSLCRLASQPNYFSGLHSANKSHDLGPSRILLISYENRSAAHWRPITFSIKAALDCARTSWFAIVREEQQDLAFGTHARRRNYSFNQKKNNASSTKNYSRSSPRFGCDRL